MRYRRLGKTDIVVSEIGFGAWGIGGDSYGCTDDNNSKEALCLALERGITFFDTSDIYGEGHSEDLIGESLSRYREKIVIATKGGTLPHQGKYMPQDFSSSHIVKALESSLNRLRTSYVDLYQLHSPDINHLTDELLATLVRLKKDGKIRAIGVSLRSPDDGVKMLDRYAFDVIQVNFNMMDQRALDDGLFAVASERGVGIIARTPFNFGFLTGSLKNLDFGEKDHRRHWPKDQLQLWSDSVALFESFCANGRKTKAQLALLFCLAFNVVSAVIPGMLNVNEVSENASVNALDALSDDEVLRIRKIYTINTFVDHKVKVRAMQERYNE